jgi:hypothetical protein
MQAHPTVPMNQTRYDVTPNATTGRTRRGWIIFLAISCGIALFLRYIGVMGGNIHTVDPHRVYRSAELTGRNLDDVLAADHIRTVLNLRGGDSRNAWYRSERAECDRYHANHVDITLSARHLPDPAKLDAVMQTFDSAPYPILVHCQAGADRTGLVSTLYLNIYGHVPLDQAEGQELTWRYGHFSFGETHAMNDFFNLYRKTGNGMDLRSWIDKKYPSLYATSPES